MSPFREPSFITEHFMIRPETLQIAFDAYNPHSITLRSIVLNIWLNKMVTERIGTVENSTVKPTFTRFGEILDKLYKQTVPCTPLSILPVRAPAEAPGGE
jgi:hypothetical protein